MRDIITPTECVCVCVCAIFAEVETGSQRYGREDEENGKYKYASRRCEK